MKKITPIMVMLTCLVGCYSYREVKLDAGKKLSGRLQNSQDTMYYAGSDDQFHYFYYFYCWWIDCYEWQLARMPKSSIELEFEFELKKQLPKIQHADPVWVRCNLDLRGVPVNIVKDEKDRVLGVEKAPQLQWYPATWEEIKNYPTNSTPYLNLLEPTNYIK
ncbi:MAG: hypothetical protein DRP64_11615 [Verrucomicrobia bacterium]|nr:MAG: hypothetical protein DRP64_11615 [Verrucomicrobiota bacterium]